MGKVSDACDIEFEDGKDDGGGAGADGRDRRV